MASLGRKSHPHDDLYRYKLRRAALRQFLVRKALGLGN